MTKPQIQVMNEPLQGIKEIYFRFRSYFLTSPHTWEESFKFSIVSEINSLERYISYWDDGFLGRNNEQQENMAVSPRYRKTTRKLLENYLKCVNKSLFNENDLCPAVCFLDRRNYALADKKDYSKSGYFLYFVPEVSSCDPLLKLIDREVFCLEQRIHEQIEHEGWFDGVENPFLKQESTLPKKILNGASSVIRGIGRSVANFYRYGLQGFFLNNLFMQMTGKCPDLISRKKQLMEKDIRENYSVVAQQLRDLGLWNKDFHCLGSNHPLLSAKFKIADLKMTREEYNIWARHFGFPKIVDYY